MTRDDLMKLSIKPYMVVHYKLPRYENNIECLLLAVDFDNETMTLKPLEDKNYSPNADDFVVSISRCSIPKMHRNHSVLQQELKNQ